ncbi:hypothetical protein PFISCL1PPCAC_2265, partial [Pristionchus fissidentatus]
ILLLFPLLFVSIESHLVDRPNNRGKFAHFVDSQPLGMGMKQLVDACNGKRGLAVECHNSVIQCLQGERERVKREKLEEESVVDHSYQDCRATMFSCLQLIIEANEDDKCTSLARSMTNSVNMYMKLEDKEEVGKDIKKERATYLTQYITQY